LMTSSKVMLDRHSVLTLPQELCRKVAGGYRSCLARKLRGFILFLFNFSS
jgi:hypothetical protein